MESMRGWSPADPGHGDARSSGWWPLMLRLTTERLELVAGNLEISEAELLGRDRLGFLLEADVPAWPPPLNDMDSMRYMRDYFSRHPHSRGWGVWYFLLRRDGMRPEVIGNGGFKGEPDAGGTVEIGYSLLEPHHGKGYAGEAIQALIDWAFSRPGVRRVIAETLPELTPSIRLLQKLGFRNIEPASEPGLLRFERLPPSR